MSETFYVVDEKQHNSLVQSAYEHRGYSTQEAEAAARFSAYASRHGIRTHNALKALHLDELFGSKSQGCVPNAVIEKKDTGFAASQVWNANKKLGQATAYEAMEAAIEMADKYGVGQVSVDNAFHYLWGGGYVMDAAPTAPPRWRKSCRSWVLFRPWEPIHTRGVSRPSMPSGSRS